MTYGRLASLLGLAAWTGVAPGFARGTDLPGIYVGAAIGQATTKVDQIRAGVPVDFDEHHVGWKASLGVRPISALGAEVEYVNFGHPSTRTGNLNVDAKVRGPGVFAVGYLPVLPLILDVYGKVGLAHLQTTATATAAVSLGVACNPAHPLPTTCGPEQLSQTENRFAWGAGAQLKWSKMALRAEYERFNTSTGHPDLLSLGAFWIF